MWMCLHVCPPPKLFHSMMWCDMDLIDLLNKFYSVYMTDLVGIGSMRGLSIDGCCRTQPNKSKLVLHKLFLYFNSHLKQLHTGNKTEGFRCCMLGLCVYIEVFKGRAGLGYR